jgi:hypothetical protein
LNNELFCLKVTLTSIYFNDYRSDEFHVDVPQALGRLHRIHIGHDNSGFGSAWFLDKVVIEEEKTGKMFEFVWRNWLDKKKGPIECDIVEIGYNLDSETPRDFAEQGQGQDHGKERPLEVEGHVIDLDAKKHAGLELEHHEHHGHVVGHSEHPEHKEHSEHQDKKNLHLHKKGSEDDSGDDMDRETAVKPPSVRSSRASLTDVSKRSSSKQSLKSQEGSHHGTQSLKVDSPKGSSADLQGKRSPDNGGQTSSNIHHPKSPDHGDQEHRKSPDHDDKEHRNLPEQDRKSPDDHHGKKQRKSPDHVSKEHQKSPDQGMKSPDRRKSPDQGMKSPDRQKSPDQGMKSPDRRKSPDHHDDKKSEKRSGSASKVVDDNDTLASEAEIRRVTDSEDD